MNPGLPCLITITDAVYGAMMNKGKFGTGIGYTNILSLTDAGRVQ